MHQRNAAKFPGPCISEALHIKMCLSETLQTFREKPMCTSEALHIVREKSMQTSETLRHGRKQKRVAAKR